MSNATTSVTLPSMHSGTAGPSCEDFFAEIAKIAVALAGFPGGKHDDVNMTSGISHHHLAIEKTVKEIAAPAICLFGIVGNILNLIILTRKSLQCSMDHMEKSAHMGLVALAVSDMAFCVVYLFTLFTPQQNAVYFSQRDHVAILYYYTYREGLINVFMFSSTWLTVIMALGRYIAVCRPLHARGFINLRITRVAIACVFAASALINIPRFLHYYVLRTPCEQLSVELNITRPPEGIDCPCDFYQQDVGALYQNTTFVFYYNLTWSILAIFHPLLILTACNVCLIRALRQSYRMQKLYRANKPKNSGHAITPTLVALIIMFTVLVGPSGILTFFQNTVLDPLATSSLYHTYMAANEFANGLVLVNYAINFVLYCIINAQFRKIAKELLCCTWTQHGRRRPSRFGSVYSRTSHNTATFNVSELETEL